MVLLQELDLPSQTMSRTAIGRRDEAEALEAVGDAPAARRRPCPSAAEGEFGAVDGALLRGEVDAAGLREEPGGLVAMIGGPGGRRGDLLR